MEIGERMTRLEALFEAHLARYDRQVTQMEQLHRDNRILIDQLDDRMNRHDVVVARAGGAIAITIFLGQLLAPVILQAVGVE
jgi:hypothetical protein